MCQITAQNSRPLGSAATRSLHGMVPPRIRWQSARPNFKGVPCACILSDGGRLLFPGKFFQDRLMQLKMQIVLWVVLFHKEIIYWFLQVEDGLWCEAQSSCELDIVVKFQVDGDPLNHWQMIDSPTCNPYP